MRYRFSLLDVPLLAYGEFHSEQRSSKTSWVIDFQRHLSNNLEDHHRELTSSIPSFL